MDNFEHWETNIREQLKKYFSELYDLRPSEAKLCVQYALNCASDLVANMKKKEAAKGQIWRNFLNGFWLMTVCNSLLLSQSLCQLLLLRFIWHQVIKSGIFVTTSSRISINWNDTVTGLCCVGCVT